MAEDLEVWAISRLSGYLLLEGSRLIIGTTLYLIHLIVIASMGMATRNPRGQLSRALVREICQLSVGQVEATRRSLIFALATAPSSDAATHSVFCKMSTNGVLSLMGWSFLPNFVTGWVQTIYYGITIRAGDRKPQPGSGQYATHRRRIHVLVVSLYLLYTIYEADWEIRRTSDFYQNLGIAHGATDKEIKSKFRRMAAMHHPDKVGSSTDTPEDFFMLLKAAQDTLLDPVKRYAYDRFGPDILGWKHCSSIRDYVSQGAQSILPYYAITAAVMWLMSLIGYLDFGVFWRWLVLGVMFTFEIYCVTRPFYPPIISRFLNPILSTVTTHPPYLPFQIISLLRKSSITIYIAFSQIGPMLCEPLMLDEAGPPEKVLGKQLDRLEAVAMGTSMEANRLMQVEMSPFMGNMGAMRELQKKIKDWLVTNTIRNDPEVRDSIGNVMGKRRIGVPHGARGNR